MDYNQARSCGCIASAPLTAERAEQAVNRGSRPRGDSCACCKASLREALRLLCEGNVTDLVDFESFAFLTETSAVGTTPVALPATEADNLGDLTGVFRRFSPGTCDLLDIEGTVVTPFGTSIEATQANLCSLAAIVFDLLPPEEEELPAGCCPSDTVASRFRRVRSVLRSAISCPDACGECRCNCGCADDCCCAQSIVDALAGSSLSGRVTLSAGPLAVNNVSILGSLGNVLILANEEDSRFYFVCANKVDFFA